MKKLIMMTAALILMVTNIAAQEREIAEFAEKTYDFGVIKESDGKVSHVFTFTNLSMSPLTLKNVRASCGCTTPSWSKKPVAPGETGEITVTYNAKNRPGAFNKSITITLSNGVDDYTQVVFIKGIVTPIEDEDIPATDANSL